MSVRIETGATNNPKGIIVMFRKYNMEPIMQFNYNKYRGKAGIYRIVNTINNKSYIGQSINLAIRIRSHIRYIKRDTENQVIYKAIRKHGADNFSIEIVTILPPHDNLKKNLDLCEKIYIKVYDSYKNGYNSTLGGDGGILGYHMSEEEKKRRSLAQKGKKKNPLTINSRSKTVYMYNYITGTYIIGISSFDAAGIAKVYGYQLDPGCIQNCARGVRNESKSFICAYTIEELINKIEIVNERKNKKTVKIGSITE